MEQFNEYIETNQWLKNLIDEMNEEEGVRLEDSFYAFKKHCSRYENSPTHNKNQQSKLLQNDVIDLIRNSYSNASARRIIKEYL